MDEPTPELLAVLGRSRELGFLGPGDLEPQISHARAFVTAIPGATRVLDLGSGGGLPGLVLACEMPGTEFVLLDAQGRRCTFLESAVEQLGISRRVSVVNGRAEEVARLPGYRGSFDAVVSRSFGPPAVAAECAVGFLDGIGAVVAISEPPDPAPNRWSTEGLNLLGLQLGELLKGPSGGIQTLHLVAECPDRYPRRVGVPSKRPLF